MIRFLLVVAANLFGLAAHAADQRALIELRNQMAPTECNDAITAIQTVPQDQGHLHFVPCRATIADVLSVTILEQPNGTLTPLAFPSPTLVPGQDVQSGTDWRSAQVTGFGMRMLLSSPQATQTGVITSAERLPAGLGTGAIVDTYRLTDGRVTLDTVHLSTDTATIRLWPPAATLPLATDMGFFRPMPTPDFQASSPLELIQTLGLGFPSPEEGVPRLSVEMRQNGSTVVANVIETGWADDSVSGVAYRVLMKQRGDNWVFRGIGRMNVCARGDRRFQTGNCP